MDSIMFNILKYYLDNGKVDLNAIDYQYEFDLTNKQFGESINYLIRKKYLQMVEEDSLTYELSGFGRQTIIDFINGNKAEIDKQAFRERLEIENLRLQNESIKYQNSLREKQEEINRLTLENLKLENGQLRKYLLYAIFGAVFTFISTNYLEILQFLKLIEPVKK